MSIAKYIKQIGRGKEGARPLTEADAHDLMCQVLDGLVTDLEVGAFAVAMRIKGETTDELGGFLRAAHERCIEIDSPAPGMLPIVSLPSYNGARKLPNLTALLALLLAQEGAPVLVHGPTSDEGRVTTFEIFQDLGLPIAKDALDIAAAWARHEPVFIATEDLCPPLAPLLAARWTIGLRNPAHTIAKLLDPSRGAGALRFVNYTHPEYGQALSIFLPHVGATALLLRGTEGEPVADPRRQPKVDAFLRGEHRPEMSLAPHEGVLTELPVLPRSIDASTTALYIQSVVSGEKPAPGPLTAQVECALRMLEALGRTRPENVELIA